MVLFRPRPDLSMEDRRALIAALATALEEIPSIRRASVGRRVRIDRPYEQLTRIDLPYAAILEFDDVGGLRAYLDHPAHEDIANRFFAALAETLIYDFEMEAGAEGLRGLLESEPC
jgi:hypothetical protein